MEESSWIWATEFVQRLSLKINILEFWNAKLPHICFDKLVWSPSSSLERTVNKHNKCKFGIISNTKYCFRWAFSYKVNGVTKKKQDIICIRYHPLYKELCRCQKIDFHCMFQDVERHNKNDSHSTLGNQS